MPSRVISSAMKGEPMFEIDGLYDHILVDGQHLVHRAAHAYGDLEFIQENGDTIPTGIIYGFLKLTSQAWARYADTMAGCSLTVCWEGGYKHRTELYPEYKANRRKQPTEEEQEYMDRMYSQQRALRKILKVAGWGQARAEGYEADDVLATLARRCEEGGRRVAIYTGDQDLHQCVTERVHVISARPGGKKDMIWTPSKVEEKWGVPPERVPEVKALAGDSSDNIPGCPGCGVGWAAKVLSGPRGVVEALDAAEAGTLTGTHKGKAWKAPSLSRKLASNREQVLVSWELAKVAQDVQVETTRQKPDPEKLRRALVLLRMHSLVEGKNWRKLTDIR